MGASFANLHVLIGAVDPPEMLERTIDAITDWMADQGFLRSDAGETDRSVLVGVDPGGRWITVYESGIDGFEDDVSWLGTALSNDLRSPTIGGVVFDSDVAFCSLFESGEQVDSIVDRPEVVREMGGPLPPLDGGAGDWTSVLPVGVEQASFVAALREDGGEDDVFAESRLVDALGLLGIDAVRASQGYRYALDEPSNHEGMSALAFVRRRLRSL